MNLPVRAALLAACLFSPPALAAFTDNGDGTVTDTATGLVWDKCAWGQTWDSADNTCTGVATSHDWAASLTLAITANAYSHRGHADWRLPNRTELESLVDITKASGPTIDATAFPNTPSGWFWSSTTFAPDPTGAWGVSLGNGYAFAGNKAGTGRVRLVRSGQSFDLLHFQAGLPLPEGPHAGQLLQVDAGSGAWQLDELSLHTTASLGAPPPAGVTVPHGVVSLRLSGGAAGSNATVVLTYPEALPAGTRYYKYGPTLENPAAHWYEYPHAVINGNTITLTLTDGGPGDSDGVANSSIVDPGGPALLAGDVAAIPSLSQWAAMLLAGLMGLFAFGRIRRLPRA